MKTYETWLMAVLAIFAVIGVVHYAVWRLRYQARLDEGALVGIMKGWEVLVVDDPEDGRGVGIAIDIESDGPTQRIYAVFSPAQARELAQWLRIGAAPGRNLAMARLNFSKKPMLE